MSHLEGMDTAISRGQRRAKEALSEANGIGRARIMHLQGYRDTALRSASGTQAQRWQRAASGGAATRRGRFVPSERV